MDRFVETVLDAIEAIAAGQSVSPSSLRRGLADQLRDATDRAMASEDWHSAAYLLSAWADEVLLEIDSSVWPGRTAWSDWVLEEELFGTRICHVEFYKVLAASMSDSRTEVLRVGRTCLWLGFRGLYPSPTAQSIRAVDAGLPSTLTQFVEQLSRQIDAAGGVFENTGITQPPRYRVLPGRGPAPRRRQLVGWAVAAGSLAMINLTVFWVRTR